MPVIVAPPATEPIPANATAIGEEVVAQLLPDHCNNVLAVPAANANEALIAATPDKALLVPDVCVAHVLPL